MVGHWEALISPSFSFVKPFLFNTIFMIFNLFLSDADYDSVLAISDFIMSGFKLE